MNGNVRPSKDVDYQGVSKAERNAPTLDHHELEPPEEVPYRAGA